MKSQRRTRRHLHYVAATRGSSSKRQPKEAATEASVMELELLPKIATTFGWLASVACHMCCCCCKDCSHCHCCCNWGRRQPRRHRRICVDNIPNSIREKNIQLLRCGNRAIEREMETKRRERGRKGEEVAQLQLLRICCKSRPSRHVASCALNADDDDDALLLPLLLAACPIQAANGV